jgi:DNA-binding CsgD family transcriptional regulator
MGQHLSQLERKAAAASALDAFAWGAFLLDADGHVLYMNREAQEQVARRDGVVLTPSGLLRCTITGTQDTLSSLITQAVARPGKEGSTVVPRRASCTPYLLHVAPLAPDEETIGSKHPAAALSVRELSLVPPLSAASLRQLFRLTPREAELTVHLSQGHTLKASSDALGITAKTARCHLATVFRKTGTRRQVDLVGLVRALAGCPLRAAPE